MRCLARRRCQTEPPSPHRRSQIILHVNCICDLDMLPLFLKLSLCVCLFLRSSFTHENCQNGEYTGALECSFPAHCPASPLQGPPPSARTAPWWCLRGTGEVGVTLLGCVRHSGKRGSQEKARRGEWCSRGSVCMWRDTRGPDSSALPPSGAAWAQCLLRALPAWRGAHGGPWTLTSSPCAQREDVAASPSLMGAMSAHMQVTSHGGLSETL